jgi:hypothetical protein
MARIYADKREGRGALGYAWASQVAMDFQIPSLASLQWIVKNPSLILLRKWPFFALKFLGKCGVALGFQAGRCCEKAYASPLTSVFSTRSRFLIYRACSPEKCMRYCAAIM